MDFKQLMQNLSNTVKCYHDFDLNFMTYLAKIDANNSNFWRVDEIFKTEAPITLKKLAIELHLVDEFRLTIGLHGYDEVFSVHRAWMSVNFDKHEWQNALKRYSKNDEVIRLLDLIEIYQIEMGHVLVSIKLDSYID